MRFDVNTIRQSDLLIRLISGKEEYFTHEGKQKVLVMGLDKQETMTLRSLRLLMRKVVQLAKEKHYTSLSLLLPEWQFPKLHLDEKALLELLAVNALLADYAFVRYKTPPKEGFTNIVRMNFSGVKGKQTAQAALRRAHIIGTETNAARSIANEPAGEMTPQHLVLHAKRAIKNLPIKMKVFQNQRLVKEKMTGIIAVGKGSEAKPRFIILEYWRGKKQEKPIVLIGKGVTFDSGGINLKPSDHILGMNMDMSGGAAVLHALVACARLRLKKNIVVLIPAVENMISGRSYRPGDIIRTASGKTIEVQDTDAEGRVILSDALHYAKRYKPSLVFDAATLTGSAVVALGERATALFTEDEKLETTLRHIGTQVGDPVWPLPLWDEYLEDIKGNYGDIGNVGNTKWGGAITAALFLKQFVDYPWVHLDIAPRMTSITGEHLAKGSIGAGVQLLVRYLMDA